MRVLTALDHRHEAQIAAALSGHAQLHLVRRCPDLPDLLAAAAAGLGDLALVSSTIRGLDRDALAQLDDAGMLVVGVAEGESEDRRLRQLGLDKVVLAHDSVSAVTEALARLDAAPARRAAPTSGLVESDLDAELAALEVGLDPLGAKAIPAVGEVGEGGHQGRVIAVWGPPGAPGRTTLAVNLASELAARGTSTLLIDADTYGACIAQVLGLLDESPGVAAAARAAELGTLDLPTLARLTPTVATGFRVLTGLPTSSRWSELRAESMRHILELARGLVEIVVVDCPAPLDDDEELSYDTRAPRRNGATLATLDAADILLVVAAADPVGLQRLVRALQDLADRATADPTLVVNRVRAGSVGSGPERRVAEALERFAGIEVTTFLPDDRPTFDTCLLAGRVLAEEAPGSVVRERIRQLAEILVPAAAAAEPDARRRWWRRSVTMGRWSTA